MPASAATPIAVIGIGCRFAGGIDSAEALWRVLAEGRSVVSEVPAHRWDVEAVYDPEPGIAGRTTSRWGAFLDDVRGFEPDFFGLTGREAELIDPQFRLLLETSCEALEHAGYAPHGVRGSSTAVVVGCSYEDYMDMMDFDRGLRSPDAAHGIIGTTRFTSSSRISYLLDLRGPAITLDTACSSSLVAVHLAAQALRSGEVDMALAGGVMLSLQAKNTLVFSTLGVLSPTGRCHAFDADADGYVRGEGGAMIALKRLPDALAAGDRVLAVLPGTGINNNGRSDTMLSPSVGGQRALQEQVLARAGVDPARVALIETHGPGTVVGDPIEYTALREVYGAGSVPCALGSVKTNIGHCETASGIAGLIKAVLAVRYGEIPANLHFTRWNPEIDPGGCRLFVPTTSRPWPRVDGLRLAAVSSYGMSGTNAHVLVEQTPGPARRPSAARPRAVPEQEPELRLYPVSAGSGQALAETAARIADWLDGDGAAVPLRDVGHTLAHRREHRAVRATVAARDRGELVRRLRCLVAGQPDRGVCTGEAGGYRRGPVWVFSGQGSQWAGMGRALLAAEPSFARVVEELESLVQAESGFSVRAAIESGEVVSGFARVQPALFTMQVALAAVWRARGMHPAAVIGHSMGEVAAAVVAGGLSLADGAAVICRRSRLAARLAAGGAMAQVELPYPQVESELAAAGIDDVAVAAWSSPTATVVSGDAEAIDRLVSTWSVRDVAAAVIPVDVASHSPQVDPVLPALGDCLAGLGPPPGRAGDVVFYGTVLADPRLVPAFDAGYWQDNLRRPVRFTEACAAALADGHRIFVEVTPHPLLLRAVADTAAHAGREVCTLPTLIRGASDPSGLSSRVAAAHCAGVPLAWPEHADGNLAEVPLPLWARQSLWMPDSLRSRPQEAVYGHPLLGVPVRLPDNGLGEQHLWQADIGTGRHPWLADHRVYDAAAFPGAGYAEMALAAAAELFGADAPVVVGDLAFHALLGLGAHTSVTTRATLRDPGLAVLEITCDGSEQPLLLATATVRRLSQDTHPPQPFTPPEPLPQERAAPSVTPVYATGLRKGILHGAAFAALTAVHPVAPDDRTVITRIALPAVHRSSPDAFLVHPVLLDVCLQTMGAHPDILAARSTFLPLGMGTVRRFGQTRRARWCRAFLHTVDTQGARADIDLLAEDGTVLARITDALIGRSSGRADDTEDPGAAVTSRILEVSWEESSPPAPTGTTARWLVCREEADDLLAHELADALTSAGGQAVVATAALADTGPLVRAITEHLTAGHDRLVLLCPAPPAHQSLAGIERARLRVRRLVDTVSALADLPLGSEFRLHVVTRNAQHAIGTTDVMGTPGINLEQSPLRGLCRVIGGEHPELRTTHVDIGCDADSRSLTGTAQQLAAELIGGDGEDEIAWRAGVRYVARLRRAPFRVGERHTTTARFGRGGLAPAPRHRGDLDSVELVTRPRRAPGASEIEIRVHTASLNFKDVLNALGTLPGDGDNPLGLDCAGEVTSVGTSVSGLRAGDRVAAFGPGALGTFITLPADTAFRIPPGMSYPEAATLPAVYLTAWYALRHLARVQPGEHVLIHSATGGLGQAAITLAKAAGAVVHATAGTRAKQDMLRDLGAASVWDSRTLDFAEGVRAATYGEGVDIVVNSLTGPALQTSLDLLRPGGRFIEVGKRDILARHQLGLFPFHRNITFASADLTLIAAQLPALARQLTREVGAEVAAGTITPLPHITHPLEGLAGALRTMAAAEHTGKLVITIPQHGSTRCVVPPGRIDLSRSDGAYLITGGLGGLGLLLARDLAEHHAGRIILNGRSRPGPAATRILDELRQAGADVVVVLGDITDSATAERLVAAATATGLPLRGIAHAAAVIRDATVTGIEDEPLTRVWGAKTLGAWHLGQATADQPLDWWLGFSSAATLIGNPGQGAYAAANGWLDAFTHHRRAQGLPAHSIQWGAWAEHGRGAALIDREFTMIAPAEGLAVCRTVLSHTRANTGYLPLEDAHRFIGERLHTTPFFTALAGPRRAVETEPQYTRLQADLRHAEPAGRRTLLTEFLATDVAGILRRNRAAVDPDTPLTDCGLDSLMATQLCVHINQAIGVRLPVKSIWKHSTISVLADHLAEHLEATAAPATGQS
ncbi:type I polyketide synthase [Streptomyces sp. AN091965]|uniref:type I polyketide synthase n=1 Tax=Streptomyces sp. AN091965 TaxID=2927803 RepID=UPI001F6232A6|nr:type I polyketide synthase [Streptomyces sp. AN091965]MCI3927839.1 type I polyketide synthase [Streptomyces sp. AN091965]